jgi:hypothetical protein
VTRDSVRDVFALSFGRQISLLLTWMGGSKGLHTAVCEEFLSTGVV